MITGVQIICAPAFHFQTGFPARSGWLHPAQAA